MARDAYSGSLWYVVNTKNGADAYTEAFLKGKCFGFDVYRPMVQLRKGSKWKVASFLPRYLFVLNDGRGAWIVKNAPGVANLTRRGSEVIQVRQNVIDEMRGKEDEGGFIKLEENEAWEEKQRFKKGQAVKVTPVGVWGAAAGFDGLFVKMSGEKRSVLFAEVLVKMMGRSVKMTVPVEQIEAA